jgi:hypothetical protein
MFEWNSDEQRYEVFFSLLSENQNVYFLFIYMLLEKCQFVNISKTPYRRISSYEIFPPECSTFWSGVFGFCNYSEHNMDVTLKDILSNRITWNDTVLVPIES